MIRRGDIYYVHRNPYDAEIGSEQAAGRPAIIVSNDVNNANSSVVEIVYLTTQCKPDMPTHVNIESSGRSSTALCEQIHAVSTTKLGSFIGTASQQEMSKIDEALAISIGLYDPDGDEVDLQEDGSDAEMTELYRKLIEAEAQAKVYKDAFYELMKSASGSRR